MQAFGKHIFIKQDKVPKKSNGGIHFPESAVKDNRHMGTVMSVGSEITSLKSGDRVLFGSGQLHKVNGEEIVVCKMDDILGSESNAA